MKHSDWFERLTSGASALAASKQAIPRQNNATISRQLNRDAFSAEVVIALARGYGQSPIKALMLTGFVSSSEVSGVDVTSVVQLLSDQELVRELARRVDDTPGVWEDTFTATLEREAPRDELAARRSRRSTPTAPPTVSIGSYDPDMPEDAVAYGHEEVGGSLDDFDM